MIDLVCNDEEEMDSLVQSKTIYPARRKYIQRLNTSHKSQSKGVSSIKHEEDKSTSFMQQRNSYSRKSTVPVSFSAIKNFKTSDKGSSSMSDRSSIHSVKEDRKLTSEVRIDRSSFARKENEELQLKKQNSQLSKELENVHNSIILYNLKNYGVRSLKFPSNEVWEMWEISISQSQLKTLLRFPQLLHNADY